jgi:hypothetical protein
MGPPTRARALPFALKLEQRAPTGRPAAFLWKFSTYHAYSHSAATYLEDATHPLHDVSKRRWAAKQGPLWLSIVVKNQYGPRSKCVRSWISRRLGISFRHSLEKKGYTPDGRPLEGNQGKSELYGTVLLYAERPILLMAQKLLQEQTDKAVNEIIRLHSGGSQSERMKSSR